MSTRLWTGVVLAALFSTTLVVEARADSILLNNGSTANFSQNNFGQSGTGVVSGTLQQGGIANPFSCTYDAVSGQFTGSPSCSQILGGGVTGGLNLRDLQQQLVNARVNVAASVAAAAHFRMIDDLIQRRIGATFALDAQLNGGMSTGTGESLGPWAYAGSSFLTDDRLGREKSGHDVSLTAGLDHAGTNFLVGGYVGYLNTDLNLKSLDGHLSSDGWMIGAYVTYLLNDMFSVSASGGYADSGTDTRRTFAGAPVTASFGHNEWSGSLTANAVTKAGDDLGLIFSAGVAYGSWRDKSYTDSSGLTFARAKGDDTWAKVGSEITLFPGAVLRPYATLTYSRLLSARSYGNDPDALSVGGGLTIGRGRINGSLEVTTVLLQSGQHETAVGLNLRLAI